MPQVDIKKVIQELVVPELKDIKSDVRELRVEIKRLDERIDSLHREMNTRFEALHTEMNTRFEALDSRINLTLEFRERFAALEAKVATLSK